MKKSLSILLLPVLLMVAACYPETLPDYSRFTSSVVNVGTDNGVSDETSRMLILNQSIFPSFSTIDLLDFNANRYYSDLFTQSNPKLPQNIGMDATEMAVVYGQLWVLMYTSCQIAVIDLPSFTLVEFIPLDFPRHMVVDGTFVYVTSYGVSATDGANAVGKVYRINAATRKMDYLYVGSQPEGLDVLGEKLYVADSGHLSWPRSKMMSVINLKKFKTDKSVELPVRHPNQVIARGGWLWVSTYGDSDQSSFDYGGEPPLTVPHSLIRMGISGSGRVIDGVHAQGMVLDNRTLWVYGNAAELDNGEEWHLYKVDADGDQVIDIPFEGSDLDRVKHPCLIHINPVNGDLYLASSDSNGNSELFAFDKELHFKWSVPTGSRTVQVLFW